jgi:uncharacterized membrane protein
MSHSAAPQPHCARKDGVLRIVFVMAVVLKGIDGVLEMGGGIFLFLISGENLNRILLYLLSDELAEDPHDLLANYLIHLGHHLTVSGRQFAAVYLLIHGMVKLFLVVNLLRNRRWAYPAAMAVILALVGYQIYRLAGHVSLALAVFTGIDVVVVILIGIEYRRRRTLAR